jgi:hypothetical protein
MPQAAGEYGESTHCPPAGHTTSTTSLRVHRRWRVTTSRISPRLKHSWEESFNRGNADAVAALYAPDTQLVMPGSTPIQGTANIRRVVADMIKSGTKVRIEAEQNGCVGAIARSETERGTYLETWRRQDGAWKIDVDINASGPAPGLTHP